VLFVSLFIQRSISICIACVAMGNGNASHPRKLSACYRTAVPNVAGQSSAFQPHDTHIYISWPRFPNCTITQEEYIQETFDIDPPFTTELYRQNSLNETNFATYFVWF
jgi:hypothetical protein